jgi:hypothetical protein
LHWWQLDWLSFPCSVLTLRFLSELAIRVTDTDIILMDTTDHIRIMATTMDRRSIGTAGIVTITATTVIITTTIGTKLT